jgi:hypothetical protein
VKTFIALLGLTLAGYALYIAHARIWPFTNCRRCNGKPRRFAILGTSWRDCHKCGGSGRRVRRASQWFRSKD